MKRIMMKTLIGCLVVFGVPFLLTALFNRDRFGSSSKDAADFTIYYEVNGSREKLSFDEYLIGVVAANMSTGYAMEALRAQAVIARTYALYNMALLNEDSDRSNFTTSELGLSYLGRDELKEYWGSEDYSEYYARLENAIHSTKDKVILYDNDLILPVFFDTGSGFTRNALEAWGVSVPYLVSVSSKQDITSTNYLSIKEYEVDDLIALLDKYYADLSLSEKKFFDEVTVANRDSAGYATKINLGSRTVSGEEFAKVIGLASNHFYIEDYEGKVRIVCNGSGHGIGLSQYGANAMAEEGSTYKEILSYYYTGTSLADLSQ